MVRSKFSAVDVTGIQTPCTVKSVVDGAVIRYRSSQPVDYRPSLERVDQLDWRGQPEGAEAACRAIAVSRKNNAHPIFSGKDTQHVVEMCLERCPRDLAEKLGDRIHRLPTHRWLTVSKFHDELGDLLDSTAANKYSKYLGFRPELWTADVGFSVREVPADRLPELRAEGTMLEVGIGRDARSTAVTVFALEGAVPQSCRAKPNGGHIGEDYADVVVAVEAPADAAVDCRWDVMLETVLQGYGESAESCKPVFELLSKLPTALLVSELQKTVRLRPAGGVRVDLRRRSPDRIEQKLRADFELWTARSGEAEWARFLQETHGVDTVEAAVAKLRCAYRHGPTPAVIFVACIVLRLLHPYQTGIFLPNLGKYITARDHMLKRLAIIVTEDAYVPKHVAVCMFGLALLSSKAGPAWQTTAAQAKLIVEAAVTALKSDLITQYDAAVVPGRKPAFGTGGIDDLGPPTFICAAFDTLGGMDGDAAMLATAVQAGWVPRQFAAGAVLAADATEVCTPRSDIHFESPLVFMTTIAGLPPQLQELALWHLVTGSGNNPRNADEYIDFKTAPKEQLVGWLGSYCFTPQEIQLDYANACVVQRMAITKQCRVPAVDPTNEPGLYVHTHVSMYAAMMLGQYTATVRVGDSARECVCCLHGSQCLTGTVDTDRIVVATVNPSRQAHPLTPAEEEAAKGMMLRTLTSAAGIHMNGFRDEDTGFYGGRMRLQVDSTGTSGTLHVRKNCGGDWLHLEEALRCTVTLSNTKLRDAAAAADLIMEKLPDEARRFGMGFVNRAFARAAQLLATGLEKVTLPRLPRALMQSTSGCGILHEELLAFQVLYRCSAVFPGAVELLPGSVRSFRSRSAVERELLVAALRHLAARTAPAAQLPPGQLQLPADDSFAMARESPEQASAREHTRQHFAQGATRQFLVVSPPPSVLARPCHPAHAVGGCSIVFLSQAPPGSGKTQAVLCMLTDVVRAGTALETALFLTPPSAFAGVLKEAVDLGWPLPVALFPLKSTPVPDVLHEMAAAGQIVVKQTGKGRNVAMVEPVAGRLNFMYHDGLPRCSETWALHLGQRLALIVDEVHMMTDEKTQRTMWALSMAQACKVCFAMTGTPFVSQKHLRGLFNWLSIVTRFPITRNSFFPAYLVTSRERMVTHKTVLHRTVKDAVQDDDLHYRILQALPEGLGGHKKEPGVAMSSATMFLKSWDLSRRASEALIAQHVAAVTAPTRRKTTMEELRVAEQSALRCEQKVIDFFGDVDSVKAKPKVFKHVLDKCRYHRVFVPLEDSASVSRLAALLVREHGVAPACIHSVMPKLSVMARTDDKADRDLLEGIGFGPLNYTEAEFWAADTIGPVILLAPKSRSTGWNGTACTMIVQPVNMSNQATRDQFVGRINRKTDGAPGDFRRIKICTTIVPIGTMQEAAANNKEICRGFSAALMALGDRIRAPAEAEALAAKAAERKRKPDDR